jgi:hypothetical protein
MCESATMKVSFSICVGLIEVTYVLGLIGVVSRKRSLLIVNFVVNIVICVVVLVSLVYDTFTSEKWEESPIINNIFECLELAFSNYAFWFLISELKTRKTLDYDQVLHAASV